MEVALQTGVENGQFDVKALYGGRDVELNVMFPKLPLNLRMPHRKLVEMSWEARLMQIYHQNVLGFEGTVKQFREHASDKIEAMAHVALPFPMQQHIKKRDHFGCLDNYCKVVFIDLKADDDEYLVRCEEKLVWNLLIKNDFTVRSRNVQTTYWQKVIAWFTVTLILFQ